jgi:hypothetical protein
MHNHFLPFPALRGTTQRLRLKISRISRDRQDPQRVRVSKAAFPALHSDNCGARLDQAQRNSTAQSKSNTIIHLEQQSISQNACISRLLHIRPFATVGS